MNKVTVRAYRLWFMGMLAFLGFACSPEAPYQTSNVDVQMDMKTVSAGFVECSFSTSKDAYYLIAIEPAREGYDPMTNQKQFMMLALDSANLNYLSWRNWLLKEGEINVAPFSSYALQYGAINHFFTGLQPSTKYWVYSFVVDPDKLQPCGKLYLSTVVTKAESVVDVHFEYRVKGYWDYIYPLDTKGNIYTRFPYIATTRDSLEIAETGKEPEAYFTEWFEQMIKYGAYTEVYYGVKAIENDGLNSHLMFEPGHTYYTAIAGFDGEIGNNIICQFTWQNKNSEFYFKDEDNDSGDGQDD